MLVLSRKEGEKIIIDDNIEVTVLEAEIGKVQIGIDAPKSIEIHREEVYRRIKEENIEASASIDIGKLTDFQKEEK